MVASLSRTPSLASSRPGSRRGSFAAPAGSTPGSRANSPRRHYKETEFIGSIDCGTTSARFYIFDQWANVICMHQIEFAQIYPEPGWHEHDPVSYTTTIDECINVCLSKFTELGYSRTMLKGVGIATQRETTLCWDRATGKPLYNAVAWPDSRNTSTVRELREKAEQITFNTPDGPLKGEDGVRVITGLPFSTYFSASKLAWLFDNEPEIAAARDNGTIMVGTVETWLLYNYTGGQNGGKFLTDVTNASRTLLLSLHTADWDPQLLNFFNIPASALPDVVSNSEIYGTFKKGHVLEDIPICSLVGDQQAALIGNKCLSKGDAKQTYGTGCFMLYHTGTDIIKSTHGLLTTTAYKSGPNDQLRYALEGSVAVGGSSINWLRDNLGLIKEAKEAGELAEAVDDTGGVYFVTGFSGLFAPYWDMNATGMLIGLSTYTTKNHIARATLEATCFQTRAILDAMIKDTVVKDVEQNGHTKSGNVEFNGVNIPLEGGEVKGEVKGGDIVADAGLIDCLKVDGGMTNSDITMQIQADILGITVERPMMRESTALGAALLAGAALKLFKWDLSKPRTLARVNRAGMRTFEPKISEEEREWKFAGWNRAVERSKAWKTESGNG